DRHMESVKQAAVADRIVLTKTDLAAADAVASLEARLRALNPAAPILRAVLGEIEPGALFDAGLYNPESKSLDVQRWLKEEAYATAHEHGHEHDHGHDHGHAHQHAGDPNRHDERVRAFCLRLERPLPWDTVATWLELLANYRGQDLLRVKAILNVEESDKPVVVHGVQHLFHPPVTLDAWPDEDRASRLVFIVRDMTPDTVKSML